MSTKLLLGTYTRRVSEGIYTVELNTDTNQLENLELFAKVGNPTYLATNKEKTIIYSIIAENDQGGLVTLVKKENGEYERQASVFAEGSAPCYVSLDEERQLVYTANYHKGEVAVYKTDENGNLEILDTVAHQGSSVHENQDAPHTHYSHLDPNGNYMIACDLGTDKVYTYEVSNEGKLSEVATLEVEPGTGPRHLVFHPTLDVAYLFGELSNEVLVLAYDPETGTFEDIQTVSSLPEDFTETSSGAAIRISSDGNYVYASNRGHDSIVTYSTDEEGLLTLINHTPTEGETPRDFNFDPSEKYLIVGHQDSDNLTLFARNKDTGTLELLQKDFEAPEVINVEHF